MYSHTHSSLAHLIKYYITIVKSFLNHGILRFWLGLQPAFKHHFKHPATSGFTFLPGHPQELPFISLLFPHFSKGETALCSKYSLTFPIWCFLKGGNSAIRLKKNPRSLQTNKTHPKSNPPLLPILAIVLRRKIKNSSLAVKTREDGTPCWNLSSFLGIGAGTKNLYRATMI